MLTLATTLDVLNFALLLFDKSHQEAENKHQSNQMTESYFREDNNNSCAMTHNVVYVRNLDSLPPAVK